MDDSVKALQSLCDQKLKDLSISTALHSLSEFCELEKDLKKQFIANDVYFRRKESELICLQRYKFENRIIKAVLEHSVQTSGDITPHKACIYLRPANRLGKWFWRVDLKSFEVIHGLSLILKMLPGKLATAIIISLEDLPSREDDGSFFIDLVSNLLRQYWDMVHGAHDRLEEVSSSPARLATTSFNFGCEPEASEKPAGTIHHSLESSIWILNQTLANFKHVLQERKTSTFLSHVDTILTLADQLLSLCHVYMDFVHPFLINIQRTGFIDFKNISPHFIKTKDNLDRSHYSLGIQFYNLLASESFSFVSN